MKSPVSLSVMVCVEYDQIFDQPRPAWEVLFDKIPTSTIVEILSFLNSKIYVNENSQDVQYELTKFLFQRQSAELKKRMTDKLSEYRSRGVEFSIISNQSSCIFLEKALEHYTAGDPRDLTIDEEERFIKAYLLATQTWVDRDLEVFENIKNITDPKDIVKFALPHFLPFHDIKRFRDFRWQIFKSMEFFFFVENNKDLESFLPMFLKTYSVQSWQEYIYKILNGFLSLYKPDSGNSAKLEVNPNDSIKSFFDSLSLNLDDYETKPDFISLRERPIFNSSENKYVFYNYSFFVDKLFQAIVFDFGNVLVREKAVKDIPDFKSRYYSENFMENHLLYGLVGYMIGKRKKVVHFDGLEWEKLDGEKGPDYYIRCGRKIFLIELKDTIFQAKAKVSRNYEVIEKELFKKLKSNNIGKPKGVTQLGLLANRISNQGLTFDSYDSQGVSIYPILIITDEIYNSYGINYVMNIEYRSLLQGCAQNVSKDLLIIHIDTLIELQDLIHDRRVPVQDCFKWYYEYLNDASNPHNQFLSFSNFIVKELSLREKKFDILPRALANNFPRIIEPIESI